jgi:hypothetical protein
MCNSSMNSCKIQIIIHRIMVECNRTIDCTVNYLHYISLSQYKTAIYYIFSLLQHSFFPCFYLSVVCSLCFFFIPTYQHPPPPPPHYIKNSEWGSVEQLCQNMWWGGGGVCWISKFIWSLRFSMYIKIFIYGIEGVWMYIILQSRFKLFNIISQTLNVRWGVIKHLYGNSVRFLFDIVINLIMVGEN